MRKSLITDLSGSTTVNVNTGFSWGFCVDLDGSTEYLSTNDNETIGVANTWTVLSWIKITNDTNVGTAWQLAHSTGGNTIVLSLQHAASNASISDNANTSFKVYTYRDTSFTATGVWHQYAMTYDGTTLSVYLDGSFVTPTSLVLDQAVTMANSGRYIRSGATGTPNQYLNSRVHSLAVWSSCLSASTILTTYNGGSGHTADLSVVDPTNLQQWVLFGDTTVAINKVTGGLNMLEASANVDATDSVADAP